MRALFAKEVYKQMKANSNIWLIGIDLGYGLWDKHFKDFPERTIKTGAAEQVAMGIAVGLAKEGKIPLIYSITTFLLYRPFETIRNYINKESLPVKLIGSGRDKDYHVDGYSHWALEAKPIMKILKNIKTYWPNKEEEIPSLVKEMLYNDKPCFVSLRR